MGDNRTLFKTRIVLYIVSFNNLLRCSFEIKIDQNGFLYCIIKIDFYKKD